MPLEATSLRGQRYSLRHVGPKPTIWATGPNQGIAFLGVAAGNVGQSGLVARPLPSSSVPSSPDFVQGTYTGRLGDVGDASLTFPNAKASDGPMWRNRFAPDGHLQWVEIYRNSELEMVGVIDQVKTDQQSVNVHASDGLFILKKAYERDWIVTQAPRDVIQRGTQVWVPVVVDNFPAGSLNTNYWSRITSNGTVSIGSSGGLVLSTSAVLNATAGVSASATLVNTSIWRASCTVVDTEVSAAPVWLNIIEGSDTYSIELDPAVGAYGAYLIGPGSFSQLTKLTQSTTWALQLESDGEWIWGFCNGIFIGGCRRNSSSPTNGLTVQIELKGSVAAGAQTCTVQQAIVEAQQPVLMAATDQGDYVLPGDATTYPTGGLHARYFNDLDLQQDPVRARKVFHPSRSQAYGGSQPAEYANQLDAQINSQQNPTPGAATVGWSCRWFGAIWLKLSAGNYSFQFTVPLEPNGTGLRCWIGKTQWGSALLDNWGPQNTQANWTFTLTANTLAGTLPANGGTVVRDGWYPIKVEYWADGSAIAQNAVPAPIFYFTPPTRYTDPGGTDLAGSTKVVVPSTSLSSLGCVDQRYQGTSHFDLVQQTAQAYDYQFAVQPQRLESGNFPGVAAPRIRQGKDYRLLLKPDTNMRTDAEGLTNYSSTLDAQDFVSSLSGNGAGLQSGTSGQLQARVFDTSTVRSALFSVEGWQDFSDSSFASLLEALLNSQLGLRLSPWQLLSADPHGASRLEYEWPLSGNLSRFRWCPGDGMRIRAREINVWDTTPRQMLTITHNILPLGQGSSQASFANRPRTPARILRQQLFSTSRLQRSYQRSMVSLTGNVQFVAALPGSTLDTGSSQVVLLPNDQIVKAYVRVSYVSGMVGFYVNGASQISSLNTWQNAPFTVSIMPAAVVSSDNRLYVQAYNQSSSLVQVHYQLFVDVLR